MSLTPKQEKAVAALLSEPSVTSAAQKAGIGLRTLHTWLAEPAFADAYRTARREAVRQAIARLQQVSSEAVTVLETVMNDGDEKGATRVSAARTVLETAIKAVELEDLAARLDALEQRMEMKP